MARKTKNNQAQQSQGKRKRTRQAGRGDIGNASVSQAPSVRGTGDMVVVSQGYNRLVARGKELLTGGPINLDANGNAYLAVNLSPVLFRRLATIAQNYGDYIFRRLTVSWVPACNTSMTGTVGLNYVGDTGIGAPTTAIGAAYVIQCAKYMGPVWRDGSMVADVLPSRMNMYPNRAAGSTITGNEAQGIVFVGIANGPLSSAGNVGYVVCDYECELMGMMDYGLQN